MSNWNNASGLQAAVAGIILQAALATWTAELIPSYREKSGCDSPWRFRQQHLCSNHFCSISRSTLPDMCSISRDELAGESRAHPVTFQCFSEQSLWLEQGTLAEGRSKKDKPNKSLFCRPARFGSVHTGLTASPCK